MKQQSIWFIGLLLLLGGFGVALGSSSYQLWGTVDGGAGVVGNGSGYVARGSVGQPDVVASTNVKGGNYEVRSGFWGPVSAPTPTPTSTATNTPLPTATAIPTATPTETAIPTATSTETAIPTATSTETAIPTATPTETAIPTATPIPVVVSVKDGKWSEAGTWSGGKVPQGEDVVNTKHVITVDTSIKVKALSNEGRLTIAKASGGTIDVTQLLTNKGVSSSIVGEKNTIKDGVDTNRKGTSLTINCDSFQNEGSIAAGSATNGNGGDVTVTYKNSGSVRGTLTAGIGSRGNKGGNVTFSNSSALALAQQSSSSLVIEGTIQGETVEILANQVEISATGELTSDGGNISIRSDGSFVSRGKITIPSITTTLQSSAGSNAALLQIVANSIDLRGSKIKVSGGIRLTSIASGNQAAGGINLAGKDTMIEAASLEVSAGPGATLNLDGMAPGAIKVTNDLILAAGTGGSISMQGATGVFSAGKITLATNKIETGGVVLKTIVGANYTKLPGKVLSHVSFGQSQSLQTTPDHVVTATVKLYNDSPDQHVYTFTLGLSNPAWKVTGLPSTQTIKSFEAADLQLFLTPPLTATVGETTVLTLHVQAKEDATLGTSTAFDITLVAPSDLPEVYTPANSMKLYLPLVSKP